MNRHIGPEPFLKADDIQVKVLDLLQKRARRADVEVVKGQNAHSVLHLVTCIAP